MTRRTSSGSNGFPNVGAALRLRNSALSGPSVSPVTKIMRRTMSGWRRATSR
ncbi:MAG TPA: hypothetical protein VFE97_10105 [Methylomirabilota bacterium]|nr:hypothetical protein [Methylomirabilota bacterium]